MRHEVAKSLCLDSAGNAGATSEISKMIPVEGSNNAVQTEIIVYAFTATTLVIQPQVSVDGVNWDDLGSSQSVATFGRGLLATDAAIGAPFYRLKFSLTGTGKAIFDAWVSVSEQ